MNDIGNNLKRIRLLKKLSLKKAGDLLNMSAPAIAKYEKGLIIPNSEKLIMFSKAYNVNVSEILKTYNKPIMKFNTFRKKQSLKGQNLELLKDIIQNKVSDYLEVIELNDYKYEKIKMNSYKCNKIEDVEEISDQFRKDYQ